MSDRPSLWVLAEPDDAALAPLAALQGEAELVISDDLGVLRRSRPADVIFSCVGGRALLEGALPLCPQVAWVHSRWAGLEHLLFPALTESPIPVTNSRGVFSSSLAEFALLGLLHFAKDVPRLEGQRRGRQWRPYAMLELRGRTLGIVGYGDIGRATARLARALGMRVLGVKRTAPAGASDELAERIEPVERLHAVLAECWAVVVATPATPGTQHLIDAAALAALPAGAVLVNVGRGSAVDEDALVEALRDGRLAGAALDVFATEPLPREHVLWSFDNVLLSPHTADRVAGWLLDATGRFLENWSRFRAGQPLLNVVDKRAGY